MLTCSAALRRIIEISHNSLDLSLQVIPFFIIISPLLIEKEMIGEALNDTDLLSFVVRILWHTDLWRLNDNLFTWQYCLLVKGN